MWNVGLAAIGYALLLEFFVHGTTVAEKGLLYDIDLVLMLVYICDELVEQAGYQYDFIGQWLGALKDLSNDLGLRLKRLLVTNVFVHLLTMS